MENTQTKIENIQSQVNPDSISWSKRAKIDTKYTGNANIGFLHQNGSDPQTARIKHILNSFFFMVKECIYIWHVDDVDQSQKL